MTSASLLRLRTPIAPDPAELSIKRVLLASEGRAIPDDAVALVAELASRERAPVNVFSIARVHGVSFGLPVPGLLPTKSEWAEQREIVNQAIKRLRKLGVTEVKGRVLGTRRAASKICAEALALGCDVIVMGADPARNRFLGDLMWSQEPQRVKRRAKVAVYLVGEEVKG